jgi:hypothetical protein
MFSCANFDNKMGYIFVPCGGIFLEKLSCTIQAFPHTFTVQRQAQSNICGISKTYGNDRVRRRRSYYERQLPWTTFNLVRITTENDRTTLLKASDYLQWTINALEKIKDSLETKYEFRNIYDSSVEFKGVELKSFQSRTGYTNRSTESNFCRV